ncbi:MAG: hypothetical protein IKN20_09035 [Firmicutes bacterium]|nr:hypothetical protein [Bacillota bacterium]
MKRRSIAIVLVLALAMLALTACTTSEFSLEGTEEKKMTVSAKNAEKDSVAAVGGLVVGEGEMVVVTANLTEGSIRVEVLEAEETDEEEAPDLSGEAIFTANLESTDSSSAEMNAGEYMVRATCLEKATGTVTIEVVPAE